MFKEKTLAAFDRKQVDEMAKRDLDDNIRATAIIKKRLDLAKSSIEGMPLVPHLQEEYDKQRAKTVKIGEYNQVSEKEVEARIRDELAKTTT